MIWINAVCTKNYIPSSYYQESINISEYQGPGPEQKISERMFCVYLSMSGVCPDISHEHKLQDVGKYQLRQ